MSEPSLLERLRRIDASSLADATPAARILPPELRPVSAGRRLVGRARTAAAHDDLMPVLAALAESGPDDVLVVATGGARRAIAGELFAAEAARRGLAGIVIDGLCRDTGTLAGVVLPVFARGSTPRASPADAVPVVQVEVLVGDVPVRPGDIVVADDDGVLVATEQELAASIDAAEAIQAYEVALRAAIEGGASLFDHLNFDEHRAAREAGRPSRLAFDR